MLVIAASALTVGCSVTKPAGKANADLLLKDSAISDIVAGEMMAGNVLGQGYTAGVGMSIGTAFGRIAGANAALAAKQQKAQSLQALTATEMKANHVIA